jgi:sugar phosphate isomerase/epimerase
MYVGCYDSPVRDLGSYALRIRELALLGFRSVGLAIDLSEHPLDLAAEEHRDIKEIVGDYGLELRLHPDLADIQRMAQQESIDLLECASRKMEPVIGWALSLEAKSICCDSIRSQFGETVAVFRRLISMTRGTELKFGVENSQLGIINSPAKMNQAVERVDDPRMGLLVDVGHINTTVTQGLIDEGSPAEFLAGLSVPIWDTHFHNNSGHSDGHLPVTDPAGTLDMEAVVSGLHDLGYGGPLNLESARKTWRGTMGAMEEAVKADRDYLEMLIARATG